MTGQEVLEAIHQLPVRVGFTSDLGKPYVKERQTIHSPAALKAFTKRWRAIKNASNRIDATQTKYVRAVCRIGGCISSRRIMT